MLADYVMKSIDNLFSQKLFHNDSIALTKPQNSKNMGRKFNHFNKDLIKKQLHTIIRRDNDQDPSPNDSKPKSPSPFSKSRLKTILQYNKNEKIRSVIKRSNNEREEASPYKKIQIDNNPLHRERKIQLEPQGEPQPISKQNDIIGYYREQRKSMDKGRGLDKSGMKQTRKSRIFVKNYAQSHHDSVSDLVRDRY